MLDLLIKDGLVIDGSGNPGFLGAIGIQGEEIHVLRGDVSEIEASRVIDAKGQVVCPGFIDFHAHSGLMILAEPLHEPKVRQGITTEVIGVDGNSYAPLRRREDFELFLQLNAGLDGSPSLPGEWSTVAEYLAMFDDRVAVNIAYVIGNSPLRISALGWEDRPATRGEVADMRAMLREGMEEGAFGLSTGLDYPPGEYADTDELVALSQEVARLGGFYHTHVRNKLGDRFLDPLKEAIEIGRRAELPSHITHLYKRIWAKGGADEILGLVEDACTEGLDVTFDTYPYTYSSTRLAIVLPAWAHDGGPERLKAIMRSDEGRERLRDEVMPRTVSWREMWVTNLTKPHNRQYDGCSVAEVAAMMDKGEVDAVCDLLLDEDLRVSYVSHGDAGFMRYKFLAHPLSMVGSDALLIGQYPSPRTYGTFPAILGEFVRDEGVMSLPAAIRKMTSFAAQRLGLSDRGLLRNGMRADICIFDPRTVKSPATRSDPKQFPVGIDYVIVNGLPVIDEGKHTGATPGRALRRGRS